METYYGNGGSFACLAMRTWSELPSDRPIKVAEGVVAQSFLPFEIDDFWIRELGNIQCESIRNSNFFLCSYSEDGVNANILKSPLHNYHHALLIMGRGYNGLPFGSSGAVIGGTYSKESKGQVGSIGNMLIHYRPPKVIIPNIVPSDFADASKIVDGIEAIYADRAKDSFLRLRKGFSAYIAATQETEAYKRPHQFVRAIEAVVKPKLWGGKNFKFRCTMFGGRTSEDEEIIGDLYEMRSAAEHFEPLKNKLTRFPTHEQNEIILHRVFQVELIARHVYRKLLSDVEYYSKFESDDMIDALWSQLPRDLIKFWGNPIDLKNLEAHGYYSWLE